MTSRQLELNIRARADTRDLEKLSRELTGLVGTLRNADNAFSSSGGGARELSQTISSLTIEEMKYVQTAARMASALEASERSSLQTAAANERLLQSQSNTAAVAARTATAEEKLAQEREKTLQATSKTEKAELDTAKAREQLRLATLRAEQAEKKATETKKGYGLATDIVHKQIQAFVSGAALLKAGRMMLDFGKDAIMAASDVEEGAAKFQQVFKDLSGGVEDDLEAMAAANRRSIYDLKDFASELQNTFVPLGFAREQAAAMSQTITQLGIDIAAFSNKADADVIHNLTSAIVGNHEAVRSYGIVLTQTVINQELARNGWDELTGAALETAKAQARLNIIMRASADAQGAAVREAGSYANTLKAWDAAVLDLKAAVGAGLLPAMTQLTEIAITLTTIMRSGEMFRIPHEEALQSAETIEELVEVIRRSKKELQELGFWDALVQQQQGTGLKLAESQISALAVTTDDFGQFLKIVGEEFDESTIKALRLDSAIYKTLGPASWRGGAITDYEENLELIYAVIQAKQEEMRVTSELAEMEAAFQNQLSAQIAAAGNVDVGLAAWNELLAKKPDSDFVGSWDSATGALQNYAEALVAAKGAQVEFNKSYGEAFRAAPVDDLIEAQQALVDSSGEWRNGVINNSDEIARIQAQLAADLTNTQKAELQKQLKDVEAFSDDYMAIIGQLEGDLTDSKRFDLLGQLSALEGQQGQATRFFSGDIEAAEEARQAIIDANQAIADSHYQRAYDALAAGLIEAGQFEHLADLAVSLGIMTREEANLRTQYAETAAVLDELIGATDFYSLSAGAQGEAIKAVTSGFYDTAEAALEAATNAEKARKQTEQFFSTAPDSTQIGDYYRQLASGGPQTGAGVTTAVSVAIDPNSMREFNGFRMDLEEFDRQVYETTLSSNAVDVLDDFESMKSDLADLTRTPWIVQIRYETQGTPPPAAGGSGGGVPPERLNLIV